MKRTEIAIKVRPIVGLMNTIIVNRLVYSRLLQKSSKLFDQLWAWFLLTVLGGSEPQLERTNNREGLQCHQNYTTPPKTSNKKVLFFYFGGLLLKYRKELWKHKTRLRWHACGQFWCVCLTSHKRGLKLLLCFLPSGIFDSAWVRKGR